VVLQGVLQILVYFVVVNRGDVVVNCVVDRGAWTTLFWRVKIFLLFEIFFLARPVLDAGFDEPDGSSAL